MDDPNFTPGPSKKKDRKSFPDAFDKLMEEYGMVDFAFVARSVDGLSVSNWTAGTGESIISDEDRRMYLHGKLAQLQFSLITFVKS